jgi:hypothetical protein
MSSHRKNGLAAANQQASPHRPARSVETVDNIFPAKSMIFARQPLDRDMSEA